MLRRRRIYNSALRCSRAAITDPLTTATGARVPGLRLAERRSHALLSALLMFRCQPHGFTNRDLRALTAELRALDSGASPPGRSPTTCAGSNTVA